MANTKHPFLHLLLFIFISLTAAVLVVQGSRSPIEAHSIHREANYNYASPSADELQFQKSGKENSKRVMIGSVAPTCTYNECRGCKYKCRAEQVPVEGNDPIHSAYHYKCVCHR